MIAGDTTAKSSTQVIHGRAVNLSETKLRLTLSWPTVLEGMADYIHAEEEDRSGFEVI
jgi:hypothetical protein